MRGIHRHYNGEIDGEGIEPPINSDHFGAFGRGEIVKPSSPTLRLRWEWMVSVTREVIVKRVVKFMCSPFVVAIEVAFVRWLAREGCRKFRWSDATWAGSETSTEEEREARPDETVVLERRLPVGGLWRKGSCWRVTLGWPPSCGGGGVLSLRLTWRLGGGLGRASWALLAPPSRIARPLWRGLRLPILRVERHRRQWSSSGHFLIVGLAVVCWVFC